MIDFDDFDDPGWVVTLLGILLVVVTAPLWLAVIGYEKARERRDSLRDARELGASVG